MSTDNEYVPFSGDEETPELTPTEPTTDEVVEDDTNLPLALIDNEADEASEDSDDILGDPDFAELPEQNQKGIQKLVERAKAKEAEVEQKLQAAEHVLTWAQRLQDPAQARQALAELQAEVLQQHGLADELQADGESKYGLTYASDDVVFERAVDAAVKKALDAINPELSTVRQMRQEQENIAKASSVVPTIKAQYGEWVTPELVKEAIQKYPMLDPEAAFNATHAKTIAKKFAEYGSSRAKAPKSIVPSGVRGTTATEYKPGEYVPFGAVLAEEFSA